MGNFLESPITEKTTDVGEDPEKNVWVGMSCMQGWRAQMEDDHIITLSLPEVRCRWAWARATRRAIVRVPAPALAAFCPPSGGGKSGATCHRRREGARLSRLSKLLGGPCTPVRPRLTCDAPASHAHRPTARRRRKTSRSLAYSTGTEATMWHTTRQSTVSTRSAPRTPTWGSRRPCGARARRDPAGSPYHPAPAAQPSHRAILRASV
jgi:hypothetical protein